MHSDTPSIAAAELTFALLLASARQLPQHMSSLQQGEWQTGVGQSVNGRTLGLFGYGRIARQVAKYAQAFGMKVQWWSSEVGRERAKADGVTLANSRSEFFLTSDVISVHARLKPDAEGIISQQDIEMMKNTATFINTSRSKLIQPVALQACLASGCPGRLALDVFDEEPLADATDPLISHAIAICTPHIGYVTEDELDMQFADIYDQINAYAAGSPIQMINDSVWSG